jgi:hypothetical protein
MMTEHMAVLVAQMAKLFGDIAKGIIPQHVAALVLSSIHNDTPMHLELVPPKEWVKVSDTDGSELFAVLANIFQEVTSGQINVRTAGEFIGAIHDHLDTARELLMGMSIQDLGLPEPALQFCQQCKIGTVEQLVALKMGDLLILREKHQARHSTIQVIQVMLQRLPLCPQLSV